MMTILLLLAGFVLLILGAEVLVRGAAKIAAGVGISPLIVGLTVVAFCTSSPELAVAIRSSWSGNVDIAVGNVVGSNIFNVLFILGLAALITPLVVAQQLLRIDVPIMIGVYLLLLLFGWNGTISVLEGIGLFVLLIGYNIFVIWQSKRESKRVQAEYKEAFGNGKKHDSRFWLFNIFLIISGLGMLILGSNWLVESATAIARQIGMSDLIIGLTIVAIGTSLPEVATSVIASLRGERDIAVGNVIGSCIFNILAVLGIAAITSPKGIPVSPAALQFDIPIMIATGIACLPIFYHGHRILRWEGAIFLSYYVFYTVYLILSSTQHRALQIFDIALLWFILPLTLLTLIIVTIRAARTQRQQAKRDT